MCILREQGDFAAAESLRRSDLERAITAWRSDRGNGAPAEEELQALFAEEARRVADAAVLCDLLLPRLLEALPTTAPTMAARPAVRVHTAPPPPAGPPAITDLLDAMLAAERPGRRSAAAPREP